jgi:alkylation response protein AidB-like acyl-CoA dehydrogenase
MDFDLTQEQKMFQDMAKEFAQREIAPIARNLDREEKFPHDLIPKMGEQGLFAIKIPSEYGGMDLDWTTLGLVTEQFASVDFSTALTYFIQTSLEAMPILTAGTEEQKKKYVPALLQGKIKGCTAAVEPNVGSDATAVETTAVLDGDSWVLNGNKTWITNASVADFAVVVAQTDKSKGHKGITTFVVDKGTPGFSSTKITHKLGCRSTDTGQLFFRDCRIPLSNQLGPVGKGMSTALTCIEHTRFGIAWMGLGVTRGCLEASIKYCQERRQFGKPIGSFQLVQEKIADMLVDLEASRLLVYHAAHIKDKGLPSTREVSIAKYHNIEVAVRAAKTAVELHGAYGYTDDFPVERFYRDIIGPLIFGGTANVQRLILGRMTLGLDAISR